MPLYVDLDGNYDAVQGDLFAICCGDIMYGNGGRLTDADGLSVLQITYSPQSLTGPGPDRLFAIVNKISVDVVVKGVDQSYILPNGMPVGAGATSKGPDAHNIIKIFYDVTQCGGAGHYGYDTSKHPVIEPGPIILFHELAHAYHEAIGDVLTVPPPGCVAPICIPQEYQAEVDENTLRVAFGLPLRNPFDHDGGCGPGAGSTSGCGGGIGSGIRGGGGGGGGGGCYIASAAFGSSTAPEVEVLLSLQEVWARQSVLGEAFFARFLSQYYAFSPMVAQRMQESEVMRNLLAIIGAEPLLDFFSLLKAAIASAATQQTLAHECETHLDAFAQRWLQLGFGAEEAITICEVTQQLGTRLAAQEGTLLRQEAPPLPLTDFSPAGLLDFLEHSVLSATTSTELLRWVLLEPLTLYWQALVRQQRGEERASAGGDLAEEMLGWLGRVPLPVEFSEMPLTTARADLESLASTLFTLGPSRLQLGARLLERFAAEVPYDLEALLRELHYLPRSEGSEPAHKKGGL